MPRRRHGRADGRRGTGRGETGNFIITGSNLHDVQRARALILSSLPAGAIESEHGPPLDVYGGAAPYGAPGGYGGGGFF